MEQQQHQIVNFHSVSRVAGLPGHPGSSLPFPSHHHQCAGGHHRPAAFYPGQPLYPTTAQQQQPVPLGQTVYTDSANLGKNFAKKIQFKAYF